MNREDSSGSVHERDRTDHVGLQDSSLAKVFVHCPHMYPLKPPTLLQYIRTQRAEEEATVAKTLDSLGLNEGEEDIYIKEDPTYRLVYRTNSIVT